MKRIHQTLAAVGCFVVLGMSGANADGLVPRAAATPADNSSVADAPALAQARGPRGRGPQRGRGRGPGQGRRPGRGPDQQLRADQAVFHYLLAHHKEIDRKVTKLDDGVETVTESDNPDVAAKIQEHVSAMHKRVREGNGLRFWDDLFAAVFDKHASIEMKVEKTEKGVKVTETSQDADAVPLIQAHADVVSLFVKHGFAEARREHAAPKTKE